MNISQVYAVYFSATGTTQKVVTTLAQSVSKSLNADYREFSFNAPDVRKAELSFTPQDLVVLGVPVYAGRVPNLILPYIRDMIRGGGALAVPVVALFGATDPELTGPYGEPGLHRVFRSVCPKSPCFRHDCPFGEERCPQGTSAAEVADAVLARLARRGG